MKRVFSLALFYLCGIVVYGAVGCDSVKVMFALNRATYDSSLDNNAALMDKFIDDLVVSIKSGTLDYVEVCGYASPDGPFTTNDRLSAQRCNVIADYISRNTGLPMSAIRTCPGGVAWEGLRALVIDNHLTPFREDVIHILDKYLPDACTDRAISNQCRNSLISIDNGETYEWMLRNIFPDLRYSLAVRTYHITDSSTVHSNIKYVESLHGLQTAVSQRDIAPPILFDRPGSGRSYKPIHRLAIKTNLLYDAALLPNVEVDYCVNKNWSVGLEVGVAWWGKYSTERSYRLAYVSPEVKYWIRPRAPWHGVYVGAFVGGGLYDFQKGNPGYHGEGAMGGLSVGYMWPISRCLSLEAAIGAGYLYTRYKQYRLFEGHHVYQRTKDVNYFGPLKAKFSIAWRLFDINKPKSINMAL